ncbi:MAG: polysaccharide biosynthesis protein [Oscillospiraceae bacterium]|nr:polysaccharide biosynthesis protein [Oscillospiraceae bacterium]
MNKAKKETSQSFMNNVTVILISQIIVKIFGAVYKAVITNIDGFGNEGLGLYNVGFQIYTLLLAISSVGIPNAISKMTSERIALGDYKGAHKIFKTAMLLFSVIGLAATLILFFGADFFATVVIKYERSQAVMRALAPSLFFVCVSSVIRGYFTGMKNMKATSNSQIIEQIIKCTLTIVFVYMSIALQNALPITAAWANFATSMATVLSFLYLIYFYYRRKSGIQENIDNSTGETLSVSKRRLMIGILMISVPISLGSIITAVNRVIDTATISRGIEAAFATLIPAHGDTAAIVNPTATQLMLEIERLSGLLSKSDILYNMPLAVNFAFATVLVPSVAGALAIKDYKEAASKINYSLLVSILIILPCSIGFITLAKPIYKIIYFATPDGYDLLQLVSVSLIFAALAQTMTGSLQGLGKVYVPAISLLFGCVAKVILNVILIRIPSVNIYGAAISSIACQFISCAICFIVLVRSCKLNMAPMKYVIKPLIAGVVMGAAAVGVYKLIILVLHEGFTSNLIATLIAIAVAAVVYFFMVFVMKILSAEEVKQLPAGNKIYKGLVKIRIYPAE